MNHCTIQYIVQSQVLLNLKLLGQQIPTLCLLKHCTTRWAIPPNSQMEIPGPPKER